MNFVSFVCEQKFIFSNLTTENPAPNNLQLFLCILLVGKLKDQDQRE